MEVTNSLLKDTTNEIKIINTYDLQIESCDDCKYCEYKIGCTKKDQMEEIYTLLNNADTLILSSPIYFGTMTDKMMKVINRFQRYYSDKFIHEIDVPTFKNMLLICTQGSEKTRMFNGAKETFHILNRLFSPLFSDMILIPSSENIPLITTIDSYTIEEIKKKMI